MSKEDSIKRARNAQGAVNQINQNLTGFNKAWNATFNKGMDSIFPSAPSIYNQFKPGAKAVGDEAGRAEKNIKQNTDRAISDTENEAARAPKNVADFLTGKNDSDQQLIKNINAGVAKIEQVGDEFRNPITRTGEQIKRSGEDIADEAGRAGKNIGAVVGDTANDVKAEAQRAPQNAVNILTGKNDSIKNTVETISGGLDQLGKNIQAGGDAWQRINCGANCSSIFPTSSVLGNALLKGGKDINAEANRAIDRIGTGKDLGRDVSRTADKAGDDVSRGLTTAVNQAGDAANQAGNAANDAGDAVADVMGW